jgi:hypothetical protein
VIALPKEEQAALYQFLQLQLADRSRERHSVLDIPCVSLGGMLPLSGDEDCLLDSRGCNCTIRLDVLPRITP